MTDMEVTDTGDILLSLVFAAGAVVTIGATMIGCQALCEKLRRKDCQGRER